MLKSEILIDFGLDFFTKTLPNQQILNYTKDLILNIVGVMLGGSKMPWSHDIYRGVTIFKANAKSTVVGFGDKIAPYQAAFINSSFGHAQDYDDIYMGLLKDATEFVMV